MVYQRVAPFIELIKAVDEKMERLRNGVARAAFGLEVPVRFPVLVSHRAHLSDLKGDVAVRQELARQFSRLARLRAQRIEPDGAKLARQIARLYTSAY